MKLFLNINVSVFCFFYSLMNIQCMLKSSLQLPKWTPKRLYQSSRNNGGGIIDPDNFLKNPEIKKQINKLIQDIKNDQGFVATVALVRSIDDEYCQGQNKNIYQFVEDLANLLSEGNRIRDDFSITVFFSIEDKMMRLRTGLKVKPYINYKSSQRLLEEIKSKLESQDYPAATVSLLQRTVKKIKGKILQPQLKHYLIVVGLWMIIIISLVIQFKFNKRLITVSKEHLHKIKNFMSKKNYDSACTLCLNYFQESCPNKESNETDLHIITLDCGHSFHLKCLDEFKLRGKSCLSCKLICEKNAERIIKINS